MDMYQELTQEFHKKAEIKIDDSKDTQLLWVSMLTEEIGELAEAVNKDKEEEIGEELADTIILAFGFARLLEIDLREKFKEKMNYNIEKTDEKTSTGKVTDDVS